MQDALYTPSPLLARLGPYFELPSDEAPEAARPLLSALPALHQRLFRAERRVVVVGALKSGKSCLINALIGAPILPVSPAGSHGTVAEIRYAPQPEARVEDASEAGERAIPFEGVTSFLNAGRGGNEVRRVQIDVPLPLLPRSWTLVDTPALLGPEAWSERTYAELNGADLAIMVLAADKILSAQEREAARRIVDLLGGNVVWVVNRLDLVDEDEREEVLEWARRGLRPLVPTPVGNPQIFATAACHLDGPGVSDLRDWLEEQAATSSGEARTVLARLGILEHSLHRLVGDLLRLRNGVAAERERARTAEDAALSEERKEIRRKLGERRLRLGTVRAELPATGERFVVTCMADTETSMRETPHPSKVRIASDSALQAYREDVSDAIREITVDLPATVPDFDLTGWILRGEVAAAGSPASDMGMMFGDLATRVFDGGRAGREAGASLGDWIGKNVFGVDARRETMQRVEQVVRGVLPSLQREAERYLDAVERLLAQADEFYTSWTHSAPGAAATESELERYERLLEWSESFQKAIGALVTEIEVSLHSDTKAH